MKEPNREPCLSPSAIHTMEHLAATFLRNHPVWADKIIYWGPMGCLTGNYLVVKGDLESKDILPLMQETFRFIAGFEGDVPGASAKDCGNYLMMNLPMARWEAAKYLHEVLETSPKHNFSIRNKPDTNPIKTNRAALSSRGGSICFLLQQVTDYLRRPSSLTIARYLSISRFFR